MRKKIFSTCIAAVLALCALLSGCSAVAPAVNTPIATEAPTVVVPDLVDVLEEDGRTILTGMGLVPKLEYIHDDTVPKGNIISCSPDCGTPVAPNSKVIVYVSKGPAVVTAASSYASWTFITNGVADDWEFYNPYVEDGHLYINCHTVTFGTTMTWRDRYNKGHASGTVSINDSFDKTVPVEVRYTQQSVSAGQAQSFTIVVPLQDLDTDKPTDLYFKIGITVGGKDTDLSFSFAITW